MGTATISDNTIFDYQKGGIVVDNVGSTATISHNTVTGVGPTVLIAQNGIQVSRGAVATVDHNTVSGNECSDLLASPPCGSDLINNDQSVGILLFQPGAGTIVTHNSVSVNDIGIALTPNGLVAAGASTIDHNTVKNNRYGGIVLFDGNYATSTVSFNTISGPGNVGIAAVATAVNTSITVKNNSISGVTSIGAFAGSGFTATVLFS